MEQMYNVEKIKNVEKHIWLSGNYSYLCEVDVEILRSGVKEKSVKFTANENDYEIDGKYIFAQIENGNFEGDMVIIDHILLAKIAEEEAAANTANTANT